VPVGVEHTALVMTLVSSVTAPVWASALPTSVAPVVMVMDARARMLPAKALDVPRVAELVTFQKTLQA
jgi:hypothetical protein